MEGSTPILHSVLNVKALVGAFNQDKALVGAFSVIVKTDCKTDGLSAALKKIMFGHWRFNSILLFQKSILIHLETSLFTLDLKTDASFFCWPDRFLLKFIYQNVADLQI